MTYEDIANLTRDDMAQVNEILTHRLSSDVALINQISSYIISSGGKRLRPLLLILVAKALGYKGDDAHLMAVVIELIHTATLLHDDVVDNSHTRRGKDTANEAWGNEAAVLTGDFLYSRAFEMMVEPNNMDIMQILAHATNKIAEGEVLQLLNVGDVNITEDEYFATIEKKTAVLFAAATHIAGVLADNKHLKELIKFGTQLGNAFQIIDDILDYQSNATTMGKDVGDDLAEGKLTLPLIYAMNNTTVENKDFIIDTLNGQKRENIDEIIKIIENAGGFEYAFNQAVECAQQAKMSISFITDNDYKTALLALCDLSLERKS
jgi:octaprenyl-diphosphate synthase